MLALTLLLAGCGSATARAKRTNVDGVDCVQITTADGGAGISCDWSKS